MLLYITDSGVNGVGRKSASTSFTVTTTPMTISGRHEGKWHHPDASVSMALKIGTQAIKLAVTSSAGTYTFSNVASGNYNVTATKTGYFFPNAVNAVTLTTSSLISNFTSTEIVSIVSIPTDSNKQAGFPRLLVLF